MLSGETNDLGRRPATAWVHNGGFINAYALDVFTRRAYLNMTFRDRATATARTVLGQRALQRPTVPVTNQHPLSDAEDFTEG